LFDRARGQIDPRVLTSSVPVVYLAHQTTGEWLVGGPDFLDLAWETFVERPLSEVSVIDASLQSMLDLQAGWHAYRQGPEESWTRAPMPQGALYLVTHELRPSADNAELEGIGGAFVNCWLKTPSLEDALASARRHLADSGWQILMEGEAHPVVRDRVSDQWMKYVRQAEVDGEVFVINAFPPETPDA
jgi:hypothetical protein